ncbi:MAG: radical SAM protein, partial [Casimicrobiaceae bacterium]
MAAAVPPVKGRGATFNPANRFRHEQRETVDDGWEVPGSAPDDDASPPPLKTVVRIQPARTII